MSDRLRTIKNKYPSICYRCRNARKPSSDNLILVGYVGCCLRILGNINKYDHYEIVDADEISEGYVDLRCRVKLGKGSGISTNSMLLTKGVRVCNQYIT